MGDTQARTRLVAITGAISALVALVLVVGSFGSTGWVAVSPGGEPSVLLVAVPLITLLTIVGTTWYLLVREARDSEIEDLPYVECGSCGRSILQEWRLCPYCGSRADAPRETGQIGT